MPTINGIYSFSCVAEGNAYPPIILLHGAGGTHLNWPAEIRRMEGRDIHALDLPGHGKSEGHGYQSIAEYARAVFGWMDATRLFRAIVIGHAMGGAIGLEMCLLAPEKVAGLGLVSSGAVLPQSAAVLEHASNPATLPAVLETISRPMFSADAPAALVKPAVKRLGETRHSVLHNDLVACARFDVSEKLAAVKTRVLVICGSADAITPLRLSQFIANKIPGAKISVVAGGSHMILLEKPAEIATLLREFFAGYALP